MDVPREVQEYYADGREHDRLERGRGLLEAMRTKELPHRWLPAAPAVVLDVGGAAGRYAIPLAAAGYGVHLLDPMPLHLRQAEDASRGSAQPLASVQQADARQLPFPLGGEVRAAGFDTDGPLAVEGVAGLAPDLDTLLADPSTRSRILDVVRATEREPALLGASGHMLIAGHKPL